MTSFTSEMIFCQFTCEWYDLHFDCPELRLFLTNLGFISFRKGFKCIHLCLERWYLKLKQMTSNINRWRQLLGLRYASLHTTSIERQLQAAFLNRRLFYINLLKWCSTSFSICKLQMYMFTSNIMFIKRANSPADYCKISKKTATCGTRMKIETTLFEAISLILDREALWNFSTSG